MANGIQRQSNLTIILLILGAAAVFLAAVSLFDRLFSYEPTPIVDEQAAVVVEEIASFAAPGQGRARSVAVVLDNHVDSRPTAGLAAAMFVREVPVEGGMTRYLAVFSLDAIPSAIGPIRSLRPYCLHWAEELDAVLLYVGGSPDALTAARRSGLDQLNQFFDHLYFWRSSDRSAPHNVFSSGERLAAVVADRALAVVDTARAWTYDAEFSGGEAVARLVVLYPAQGHSVAWEWDATAATFVRRLAGVKHVDADGTHITAANVLVQMIDAPVVDAVGRLRIATEGSGDALMLRDGRIVRGTWRKTSDDRTRFYDASGNEHVFAEGKTWIQVVPTGVRVNVE